MSTLLFLANAAAVALLVACTPPRLAQLPPQPLSAEALDQELPESASELVGDPFVRGGEYALYELRFRGVAIAELEVLVGERGVRAGLPTYVVHARAEASGVVEIAIGGWWMMTTELSLGGHPRPDRVARETWEVSYAGEEASSDKTLRLSDNRHSFLSAIGAVRAWDPRLGDAAAMKIDLHAAFNLVMVAIDESEPGIFSRPSIRVVGRAGHRRYGFPFEFWISRDRDRIPLLVRAMSKWGKVELELLGYKSPT